MKHFRYFDLDNDGINILIVGCITKDEFKRSLTNLGITSISESNIGKLFDIYDSNKNRTLDCKEFISILYPSEYVTTPSTFEYPKQGKVNKNTNTDLE